MISELFNHRGEAFAHTSYLQRTIYGACSIMHAKFCEFEKVMFLNRIKVSTDQSLRRHLGFLSSSGALSIGLVTCSSKYSSMSKLSVIFWLSPGEMMRGVRDLGDKCLTMWDLTPSQ